MGLVRRLVGYEASVPVGERGFGRTRRGSFSRCGLGDVACCSPSARLRGVVQNREQGHSQMVQLGLHAQFSRWFPSSA